MVIVGFGFGSCQTDKQGAEKGKNVGLQYRHQHFKALHKKHKSQRNRSHGHAFENKNQGNQAENDNVTSGNVSEQTNGQRNRFGDNTHQFNRHHDGVQPKGHVGFENMTPIMLVTAPIGNDHGKDRKYQTYFLGKSLGVAWFKSKEMQKNLSPQTTIQRTY